MQGNLFEVHAQGRLPLDVVRVAPSWDKKPMAQYAYTIKTSRVKEPDFPYSGQQLTCTSELVGFLKSLKSCDIEKFIVIYLDMQNQLLCLQITNGIVNQAVVYTREVLRHALLANASAIILAHNHPGGHPQPSDADMRLTRAISETAHALDILVHDHVIIGGDSGEYYSMREAGVMPS